MQQQVAERAAEEIDVVLGIGVDRGSHVGRGPRDEHFLVSRNGLDRSAVARIASTPTAATSAAVTATVAPAPVAAATVTTTAPVAPAASTASSSAAAGPLLVLVTPRRLVVVEVRVVGRCVVISRGWSVVVVAGIRPRSVAVATTASPAATASATTSSAALAIAIAIAVSALVVAVLGTPLGTPGGIRLGVSLGIEPGLRVCGNPDQRLFAADPQESALTLPNDLDVDLIATTFELT
jgi:hypothetical protein